MLAGIVAFVTAIHNPVAEPPATAMIGWNTGEMPANVTIFYDIDRDQEWDIAYNHPIISQVAIKTCDGNKLYESRLYRMLSTCAAHGETYKPVNYTILKEPSAYMYPGSRWKTLYRTACGKTMCEVK